MVVSVRDNPCCVSMIRWEVYLCRESRCVDVFFFLRLSQSDALVNEIHVIKLALSVPLFRGTCTARACTARYRRFRRSNRVALKPRGMRGIPSKGKIREYPRPVHGVPSPRPSPLSLNRYNILSGNPGVSILSPKKERNYVIIIYKKKKGKKKRKSRRA